MRHRTRSLAAVVLWSAVAFGAHGAELLVRVEGVPAAEGTVSCGLFASDAGFPDDDRQARVERHPADPAGVACRFADVPAGRVAVAVSHDRNGNGRLDKNFVGMPREPWGVSNGVRPTLRAPRFAEAAFEVPAEGMVEVRVVVAQ